MNVLLWTDIDTLLTLEAIPADLPGAICWKTDLRREGLRTCFTSFSAFFSRSVKGEKRQYRKQGKYCSHGAEEPAKESFLYTHASHQKEQDHKADPIASQTEVSCMDHGKYIPRAGSLCFSIYSSWGNFFIPYILLSSKTKLPAAVMLYQFFGQHGTIAYGPLAAYSIIYALPSVLLYVLSQNYMSKGFTMAGAAKG